MKEKLKIFERDASDLMGENKYLQDFFNNEGITFRLDHFYIIFIHIFRQI